MLRRRRMRSAFSVSFLVSYFHDSFSRQLESLISPFSPCRPNPLSLGMTIPRVFRHACVSVHPHTTAGTPSIFMLFPQRTHVTLLTHPVLLTPIPRLTLSATTHVPDVLVFCRSILGAAGAYLYKRWTIDLRSTSGGDVSGALNFPLSLTVATVVRGRSDVGLPRARYAAPNACCGISECTIGAHDWLGLGAWVDVCEEK
ncbi:hypothetical protein B0H16DRAFT_539029 [Mycena metata]|uniref:Uncharacterized protein n=1 Tax=Mycena metata TaxID=1033252 RepID=A0AAD7JC60_9AGAR|nr:hypothetical protein B0H16DRAFT_539029 [Mycena metata]